MYLNCAASCGICTVRYLHGAEVPQTVRQCVFASLPASLHALSASILFGMPWLQHCLDANYCLHARSSPPSS